MIFGKLICKIKGEHDYQHSHTRKTLFFTRDGLNLGVEDGKIRVERCTRCFKQKKERLK